MKSIFKMFLIITGLFFVFASPSMATQTVYGPVLGNVSSWFGLRTDPINGFTKNHQGIDIAAPYGSFVFAVQDGIVTKSGSRGGYGLAIEIDHYYQDVPQIPRVQTIYGHCSYLYAKPGQYVKRGQVIALVGSTGRSTGPHLHFEVRYLGKPVDPIDYLVKLPAYIDYVAKARERARYVSNQYSY